MKAFCVLPFIFIFASGALLTGVVGSMISSHTVINHTKNGICYNVDTGKTYKCRLKEVYKK